MAWIIDKTFEFCYGHRVWTQKLNGEYAADLKCACRHLHGHEGKMQVYLRSPEGKLDPTGMVTDFRHLEWLKKWINEYIDHQFVLDKSDPLYNQIVGDRGLVPVLVPNTDYVAGWQLDLTGLDPNTPEYEYYDGPSHYQGERHQETQYNWSKHYIEEKEKK